MRDLCYRKDTCKNHPQMCGMCATSSDIQNHYPLFKNKDEVEVVRCKDCKYWQDNNGGYPHDECRCGKDETPDADDFCSYGERSNENAE